MGLIYKRLNRIEIECPGQNPCKKKLPEAMSLKAASRFVERMN